MTFDEFVKTYKGKKIDYDKLKPGMIIAYKYDSNIIIHRLVDVEKVDDEY